jgi:hypothetical protein
MEKVRGRTTGPVRADSSMTDEEEMEKSFWLIRPDGWVVNRKMKKIILLEFKKTSDPAEAYFWYVEGDEETVHPHSNGSLGPGGRTRLGGRCCPIGRRTEIG